MLVLGLVDTSPDPAYAAGDESVGEALCRLVDSSARAERLPISFLTRLIWQESSFRPDVTSRAGAAGVAQFMPGTARERGLADPFDPETAIPAAASLLAELRKRFGNLGLAAAAYNGGPNRVANWLAGKGDLPDETRSYVARITGRMADDWAADSRVGSHPSAADVTAPVPEPTCVTIIADLRRPETGVSPLVAGATAPWGVQLSGNFSKERALASYNGSRARFASIIGEVTPMIIGTRFRSRGTRLFYRVRVPAQSRRDANAICTSLRAAGGACVVLRS